MNNQDLTNREEVPMENLFQEASQDYREPVSEKDFDQFMSQLEDTGFFNEEKSDKKPFIFILSAALLAGLLLLGFWVYKNSSSSDTSITEEKNGNRSNSVLTNEEKTEDTISTSSTNTEVKSTVKVVGKKSDKQSDKQNSTINSVKNNITPIVIPGEAKTTATSVIAKDTVSAVVLPEKTKAQKDSVRIRYVMAVDTVRTVDTTNIKKKSKKR